jgi:PhnB protein
MATVNPYLYFNGNCEEAFNFYSSIFRKEITYLGRYKDVPTSDRPIFAEADDKVMHVTLPISSETTLMGSDNLQAYSQTEDQHTFSLIVHASSTDEADQLFNGLAEGGTIKVAMNQTFWGSYYGICVDKFGIMWKITT